MPIKQPDDFDWMTTLILLLIAAVGSAAKMSYEIMRGEALSFALFLCQITISLFSGGMAVLIASHFNATFEIAGCAAGVAGWMGGEFVRAIAVRIKRRIRDL